MNRIYKKIISNKTISFISLLLAIASIVGIVKEIIDKGINNNTTYLVGFIMIFLVFLRTILSDFSILLFKQNNAYCNTGQYGSKFDLENFITRNTYDLFIIGQNLRTILSANNLDVLKRYLYKKNNTLTLILTPYDILKAFNDLGAADLLLSIKDLNKLKNSLDENIKERLNIWFHYGTITLSAMIKNPKDTNAILVLNPKWAYDRTPDNRVFCVIKKNENHKCFTAIWSGITSMLQSERISLEEMESRISSITQ